MTICSGLDSFCLFLFFSLLIFFPPSSSCKIGVWLNTCKLCCDYQPLKSSLKLNLYIVKFPRLIISSVRMCLRVCTRTSEVTQIFIVFLFYLSQTNAMDVRRCLSTLYLLCTCSNSVLLFSYSPADGAWLCRLHLTFYHSGWFFNRPLFVPQWRSVMKYTYTRNNPNWKLNYPCFSMNVSETCQEETTVFGWTSGRSAITSYKGISAFSLASAPIEAVWLRGHAPSTVLSLHQDLDMKETEGSDRWSGSAASGIISSR